MVKPLKILKGGVAQTLSRLPISSEFLGPPKGIVLNAEVRFPNVIHRLVEGSLCERALPVTPEPEMDWRFLRRQNDTYLPVYLADLTHGRFWDNVVIHEDRILWQFSRSPLSWDKPAESPHMRMLRIPKAHHLSGVTAVLGDLCDFNYWHWLNYGLTRLAHLKKIIPLEKVDHFLIHHEIKKIHRETLTLLGIPAHKLVSITVTPHVKCDRLLATTWPSNCDPQGIRFLRETFLNAVGDKKSQFGKRLYLSRQKSYGRHIENETAFLEFLKPYGFETIFCEEISVADQVRAFRDAEILIGAHGANFSNLMFSSPPTQVIEVFPSKFVDLGMYVVASTLELPYGYILCDGPRCPEGELVPMAERNGSVSVPLEKLKKLFSLMRIRP